MALPDRELEWMFNSVNVCSVESPLGKVPTGAAGQGPKATEKWCGLGYT